MKCKIAAMEGFEEVRDPAARTFIIGRMPN